MTTTERLQNPGRVCLVAVALQPLVGAAGTGTTALLLQLAFEPPGPSIVAIKLVLALVAHEPVPVQLLALQLPEAGGETDGCLVESIIPDPVRFKLQVAVVPWRVAESWHAGGVNFGRVARQLALPC